MSTSTDKSPLAISNAQLDYIAVDNFTVDKTYQREPDQARINRLAKNWKDEGLGVIIASKRPDESRYFALDGQHRLGALRRLERKTDRVPTLVLEGLSLAEEAEMFVLMNKNRKALTPSELFQASIAEGDPAALEIKSVTDKLGISLDSYGQQPNTLRAVASLWRIYNATGASGINATLSLALLAWGDPAADNAFNQTILISIARILQSHENELDMDRLRRTLSQEMPDGWISKQKQMQSLEGGQSQMILVRLWANAYNKGIRSSDQIDVVLAASNLNFNTAGKFKRKTEKDAA